MRPKDQRVLSVGEDIQEQDIKLWRDNFVKTSPNHKKWKEAKGYVMSDRVSWAKRKTPRCPVHIKGWDPKRKRG
jgi:hypothetical protein